MFSQEQYLSYRGQIARTVEVAKIFIEEAGGYPGQVIETPCRCGCGRRYVMVNVHDEVTGEITDVAVTGQTILPKVNPVPVCNFRLPKNRH